MLSIPFSLRYLRFRLGCPISGDGMIIDFQHHYTPPELMERGAGDGSLRLDENGSPIYRFNPLLADLPAHVRMMDNAGIDVAVLSCGSDFDQPSLATCQLIDDQMHQAELDYPGRFIGIVGWAYMDADDPWRMLGWEFSLMVATVRLINSGLFDELPSLKVHVSHFGRERA